MLTANRVLILEDEPILAMLLARIVADLGHGVLATVGSVAQALVAVRCVRPDLMIVDKRLRDGSGVAAVQQISLAGFVPHVFVSGETCSVVAPRPGSVTLEKPYVIAELAHAIQTVLSDFPSPSVP
ncbi:response regulator [Roseomonas fluvialis]|uniref:Response regulatory domain-containing protein n=1 Tax=Roseomonas fluvialis TaxID=1750527 RepID=A0ABN6NVU1_9PROT|nr:response regulator [Roseomonas fluvialis]BDG70465.1 hypothetical protein Rmf_03940 [Roseomonas fluvialis]